MKKQAQKTPDIVGLITQLQEQVAVLDKKLDALISRSPSQPADVKPVPRPAVPPVNPSVQGGAKPQGQRRERQMHQATCADCKKACEVPFKPAGDRPVYCKECFLHRKNGPGLRVAVEPAPKEVPLVQTVVQASIDVPESPVKAKKKPAPARKPAAKKKPVVKKKK